MVLLLSSLLYVKEVSFYGLVYIFVAVFVIIGACIVVELGSIPWLLFTECFATMFVYYAAHWQTYCSGVRHFSA